MLGPEYDPSAKQSVLPTGFQWYGGDVIQSTWNGTGPKPSLGVAGNPVDERDILRGGTPYVNGWPVAPETPGGDTGAPLTTPASTLPTVADILNGSQSQPTDILSKFKGSSIGSPPPAPDMTQQTGDMTQSPFGKYMGQIGGTSRERPS
jgi:hypothetical protein